MKFLKILLTAAVAITLLSSCNKSLGVITPSHIGTELTVCSNDTVRDMYGFTKYTIYKLKDESGATVAIMKVEKEESGYKLGTKFTITNYTNVSPTKDSI